MGPLAFCFQRKLSSLGSRSSLLDLEAVDVFFLPAVLLGCLSNVFVKQGEPVTPSQTWSGAVFPRSVGSLSLDKVNNADLLIFQKVALVPEGCLLLSFVPPTSCEWGTWGTLLRLKDKSLASSLAGLWFSP